MNMNFLYRKGLLTAPALFLILSTGCNNQVYDDLDPCQANYHLKFRYDYNMKYADAFPAEVNSVAVWAFDSEGKLVWSHKEEGENLSSDNYRVDVPLPPGKYDFITWCGLSSNSPFNIDTETPSTLSELGTTLSLSDNVRATSDDLDSKIPLSGLYHSLLKDVELKDTPHAETDNEILLPLIKDTNYIKILLQNLDGTEMKTDDFSFHITGGNTRLEYDNTYGVSDEFHYHPWNLTSASVALEGENPEDGVVTSVSSVLAELHTSRLMADSKSLLVVHRNTDNKDIIRIPLVNYLLLVKGNYQPMTDQEYLDRQDDYSMTFFIDSDLNWYSPVGIYINAWHVVPPQNETLH